MAVWIRGTLSEQANELEKVRNIVMKVFVNIHTQRQRNSIYICVIHRLKYRIVNKTKISSFHLQFNTNEILIRSTVVYKYICRSYISWYVLFLFRFTPFCFVPYRTVVVFFSPYISSRLRLKYEVLANGVSIAVNQIL